MTDPPVSTPDTSAPEELVAANRAVVLSREEMEAIYHRVALEVISGGDLDLIDDLFDADFLDHDPVPGVPAGRDGFKRTVEMLRTAFPDLTVVPQHVVVEGDKLVEHGHSTGTHDGPLMSIPATHVPVRLSVIATMRFNSAGKIAERWGQFNFLEVLQQIGVVPGADTLTAWAAVPELEPGRSTAPEQNKAIVVRHIEEIWNAGRYEAADELCHPRAVAPYAPQLPPGPDGCKIAAAMFREAFPDLHVTAEDVFAEGDLVAARLRLTGTHHGELFGIPPTGRRVDFQEMAMLRIVDGRIAVSWFQTDFMTMMAQMGVGPGPATA